MWRRFALSLAAVVALAFMAWWLASPGREQAGFFKTGQPADLLLSGIGFNNAGGPLLFNHNGGIATDGHRLILADRTNNRILIWNRLPDKNVPPDIVLGQHDFLANDPGDGPGQFNWPIAVATDGTHLFVADTYNGRILIWNTFPKANGQPANVVLRTYKDGSGRTRRILWPWAVWTDGEKLIATSTFDRTVLIWNSLPTRDNQDPDVTISVEGFGTPRSIASDGRHLVIGDHNGFGDGATFFWRSFPERDDQPYDFSIRNALAIGKRQGAGPPGWLYGPAMTPEGKLVAIAAGGLVVWNAFPSGPDDAPDLVVGSAGGPQAFFSGASAGDGSGVAVAGDRLFISLANGNRVVVYNSWPDNGSDLPDFAIGSPNIHTNTLTTRSIITNPILATDGQSLLATSDFDRKLSVWKRLPRRSGTRPDVTTDLSFAPLDNELNGGRFVAAGHDTVAIWDSVPRDGREPDRLFRGHIGAVTLEDVWGVALDDRYFYLSDARANRIYVWNGIPEPEDSPAFSIPYDAPGRLASDGVYLAVGIAPVQVQGGSGGLFRVGELNAASVPVRLGNMGAPQFALPAAGHLFIAETGQSRVRAWMNIEDALAGKEPDAILGNTRATVPPEEESGPGAFPRIGRYGLFLPLGMAFDGRSLWVGENKFSYRILRFSPD